MGANLVTPAPLGGSVDNSDGDKANAAHGQSDSGESLDTLQFVHRNFGVRDCKNIG